MSKQDGELSSWLFVGGLFTLTLIGFDFWYSSFHSMEGFLKGIVIILHIAIAIGWVVEMIKFNDPNFDELRRWIAWTAIIVVLIVGLQHAFGREDKQVLIDSKANAEKQRIDDSLFKIQHLPHPKDTIK